MKQHHTFVAISLLCLSSTVAFADQLTVLGSANTYGVLAATTITSSGATIISGNLGLYSGNSVTGFPPGVVTGTMHINDPTAETALFDAQAGYTYLSSLTPTQYLTGQDLGGLTLGPGVFDFTTSATLNGNLVLDFGGANNADIVFIVGTSFTTAADSAITVINQGLNDNVYYAVGTSASLGANSVFAGDIIAGSSIGFGLEADSSCGSAIALNGAITLLSNLVNNCSSTGSNINPYTAQVSQPPATTPEPGTLVLLATGLLGGAGMMRRKTSV